MILSFLCLSLSHFLPSPRFLQYIIEAHLPTLNALLLLDRKLPEQPHLQK
jgi:hypothetical protein